MFWNNLSLLVPEIDAVKLNSRLLIIKYLYIKRNDGTILDIKKKDAIFTVNATYKDDYIENTLHAFSLEVSFPKRNCLMTYLEHKEYIKVKVKAYNIKVDGELIYEINKINN